jgi:hypothetical protein
MSLQAQKEQEKNEVRVLQSPKIKLAQMHQLK